MAKQEIEAHQKRINELGYGLKVDGDFGEATLAASLAALKTGKPASLASKTPIPTTPAVVYPASVPTAYTWLKREGGPRIIVQALALYGTLEKPGSADNPVIMSWAKELGLKQYTSDLVPWCGLFAAIVVKRAGFSPVKDPLWALNWKKFGVAAKVPMLGDILVKPRDGGGHVTFMVGEDEDYYHCLGGNQLDKVGINRYPKKGITWSFRRPKWLIAQPPQVRVVKVKPGGAPLSGSDE